MESSDVGRHGSDAEVLQGGRAAHLVRPPPASRLRLEAGRYPDPTQLDADNLGAVPTPAADRRNKNLRNTPDDAEHPRHGEGYHRHSQSNRRVLREGTR